QLMWDDKSTDKLEKILAGNFTPELIQKLSAEETANTIGLPIDMASVHYPMGGWLCPAELTRGLIKQLEKTSLLSTKFEHLVEALDWDEKRQLWLLTASGQT
ncbi:bifunctional tRNA (5-methylaminomethyl-2-thiouridine)(34)-methyltransferase MnmD/FAD-dependent 5-carboxymethylaminomethyl-2-thiouridine(34) oxidoreductase MnmC, partial [Vibrio parahaemolyticus]|nr:bifunctional tRNA (5-methylaminomethyl-2-thiouridine)(34)-methyltransferase MnmD/FAD-dependent 5-carboxymethylaminomethyl-2-thiouridine(34) oxidoreductase MnmC [Vibrio parahaemolyticus]